MASDFGSGLGTIIGGTEAAGDLSAGMNSVNGAAGNFAATVAPYNQFGQSYLPNAVPLLGSMENRANTVTSYEDFMKNYQTSPGAQYQMQTADQAQENSAAARGGLLSGSNLRALSDINQGISSTYANQAYQSYLQGNQQQFGQLENVLGNMFQAIGVGQTATGQQAGVTSSQMNNEAALAQAQAKNDQGKGSGFGSLFSGIGSFATKF